MQIEIDEKMAHVILGALNTCDNEGIMHIEADDYRSNQREYNDAELKLIDCLYQKYPEIVKMYDNMWFVKEYFKNK